MESNKRVAGEKAVEFVRSGMAIGLGTGSTIHHTIIRLGQMVEQGLRITAVPTSLQTEQLAAQVGIPLADLRQVDRLDLVIDGADEVDARGNMIKGGGGALLREKILAQAADRLLIVVDQSKLVQQLGRFPLPVEVVPFGWEFTVRRIARLGSQVTIRKQYGEIFVTDNDNFILDCRFGPIVNPQALETALHSIAGVVESGLFIGMLDTLIVGGPSGARAIRAQWQGSADR